MSKHALDLLSPSPSPSKRTRFEPGTSSPPHRYTTAATSDSSPFTRYSFPSSGTGPSTPYCIPSDSPSNPFGLQRALVALKLPQPTGFRRHVPLRFQLVYDPPRRDAKGKGKAQADGGEDADASRALARELENVYRVVQVPANYTFRHLHKLILWLFAADAHWAPQSDMLLLPIGGFDFVGRLETLEPDLGFVIERIFAPGGALEVRRAPGEGDDEIVEAVRGLGEGGEDTVVGERVEVGYVSAAVVVGACEPLAVWADGETGDDGGYRF